MKALAVGKTDSEALLRRATRPMITPTLYWHDYETSGADKRRDRPLQFAGIRTTLDLIPVGDPTMVYCKPSPEVLPQPGASLITGLTPQACAANGTNEETFARRVLEELGAPGTCGVGYNSLRFDDEITRNLLYRNFHDPYEREWRNENSRWDLIDLVRLCYALRPSGIEWPVHPDGSPSFRLEDMAAANRLEQARAHDALSDVEATIQLARLLRQHHPGLFDFYFKLRRKQEVMNLVDMTHKTPLLHVSSFYPAQRGCLSAVVPLAYHPTQQNGFIVYDLMADPTPLLTLDADALAERVFASGDAEDGPNERLPLTVVHANRCPALVPTGALKGADTGRIGLDLDRCRANLERLKAATEVPSKVQRVFGSPPARPPEDPELSLYGGFASERDKQLMKAVREASPEQLAAKTFAFQDPRFTELLFRYRARNWPDTLSDEERTRWEVHRRERILGTHPAASINLDGYRNAVAEARGRPENARRSSLLDDLDAWGNEVAAGFAPPSRPKP